MGIIEPIIRKMIRTYTELSHLSSFEERFNYLKLDGVVGKDTFGFDRYLNQVLYHSDEWKRTRQKIIIRDNGCDLGCLGYDVTSHIIIHHMNPITLRDIEYRNPDIFNPEYLISVSHNTHQAIHYGDITLATKNIVEIRKPNDTKLW